MKKIIASFACFIFLPAVCYAESIALWRSFDLDKDNALSLQEFGNYRSNQYVELDADMDGKWTRREFVQRPDYMQSIRPDELRKKFKRWDKNKDGYWTQGEAEKAIKGNFYWLDKDKSKAISLEEMPKGF